MPKHDDWIFFAEEDLVAADVLICAGLVAASLYHCQQAVEKALKGFLVAKGHDPRRTHDLIGLTRLCIKEEEVFEDILDDVAEINPFSTQTRYPDDLYHIPDLDYARIILALADKIVHFVKMNI